jgi:uncharacterized protein YjbI with pentapeptide repeats
MRKTYNDILVALGELVVLTDARGVFLSCTKVAGLEGKDCAGAVFYKCDLGGQAVEGALVIDETARRIDPRSALQRYVRGHGGDDALTDMDLQGLDLHSMRVDMLQFNSCALTNVSMRWVDVGQYLTLSKTALTACDLSWMVANMILLREGSCDSSDIRGSLLRQLLILSSTVTRTDFGGAVVSQLFSLQSVQIFDCRMSGGFQARNGSFSDSRFVRVDFRRERATAVTFAHVKLTGTHFESCDLTGAFFYKCEFKGCKFVDTNVTDAHFMECKFENCEYVMDGRAQGGDPRAAQAHIERDTIEDVLVAQSL